MDLVTYQEEPRNRSRNVAEKLSTERYAETEASDNIVPSKSVKLHSRNLPAVSSTSENFSEIETHFKVRVK